MITDEERQRFSSDFHWFLDHYDEIFEKYGTCHVAIRNKEILGVYPSILAGIKEMEKAGLLGRVNIQFCNGEPSGYSGYISDISEKK